MPKSKHSSNNNVGEELPPLASPQILVKIKKPTKQDGERKKSRQGKRKALKFQRMENLGNFYLESDDEVEDASIDEFESAEVEEQIEERGEEGFPGLELLSLASIILSENARNVTINQPEESQDSELPSSDIQEDDHLDNPHIIELEKAKNEEINKLEREKEDRISRIDEAKEKIINFYTLKREGLISQSSLGKLNIEKEFIFKQKQYKTNLIQQKHQITEEYIDIEEKLNAEYKKSQKIRADEIKSLNLEEVEFNEEFNKDHSEVIKKIEENQALINQAQALIDQLGAHIELRHLDYSCFHDEANKIKNSYQEEIDEVKANYSSEVKNIKESFKAKMSSLEISDKEEIKKIITDEEIIDFLRGKGVYDSISSLDRSFKANSDLRLNHISDSDLRVLAENLSIAEGDFDFFARILKGGKDFINENLGKPEEEKIWNVFDRIMVNHKSVKVFNKKINRSDVLKIFIDSNLSFKGKSDKIINRVLSYRNPGLLNKLIKDDPEYFKNNQNKIDEFFNKLVKQGAPKMAFSVFLAAGGWDINKKDKDGNTALHLISNKLNLSKKNQAEASLRSQNVMVNILLLLGADPRIKNAEGQLPGHNFTHDIFNKINTLLEEYRDKKNSIEARSGGSGGRFDNAAQALMSLRGEIDVSGESGGGIDGGSRRGGGERIEEEIRGDGGEGRDIENAREGQGEIEEEIEGDGGERRDIEKLQQFYERERIGSLTSSLNKRNLGIFELWNKMNLLERNPVPIILQKLKGNLQKLEGCKEEIEKRKSFFDNKMRKKKNFASNNWGKYEKNIEKIRSEKMKSLRENVQRTIQECDEKLSRIDELVEPIKQEEAQELEKLEMEKTLKLEKLKIEEAKKLENENEAEISRIYDEKIKKIDSDFNLKKEEILTSYQASSRREVANSSKRPNATPQLSSSSGRVMAISRMEPLEIEVPTSGPRKRKMNPVVKDAIAELARLSRKR